MPAGCSLVSLNPVIQNFNVVILQCTMVSCFCCESNVNGVAQFWIKMQMACECQWTYNVSLLELFMQPNIVVKSFPWAAVDVVVCCCGWYMQGLLGNTEKDRVRRLIGSSLPWSHDFPSWWIFPVHAGIQVGNACWELYCLEHGILVRHTPSHPIPRPFRCWTRMRFKQWLYEHFQLSDLLWFGIFRL